MDEVKELRREAGALKEVVAELTMENRLLKCDGGWGGRRMRYPATEKLEIIRLVEQSALPVPRTLGKIGVLRATSDAARQSCCREKGSSERPSHNAACSTDSKPPNVINQTSQSLP